MSATNSACVYDSERMAARALVCSLVTHKLLYIYIYMRYRCTQEEKGKGKRSRSMFGNRLILGYE